MKPFFLSLLISVISLGSGAQAPATDSLLQLLAKVPDDTNRVNLLLQLADKLYFYQPAASLQHSTSALKLSRQLKYSKGIAGSLGLAGEAFRLTGDYPGALKMQFEALELLQDMKDIEGEATCLGFIGASFINLQEYRQALQYLLRAVVILQTLPAKHPGIFTLTNTGRSYDMLKMPDSALFYLRWAGEQNKEVRHPQLESFIPTSIGSVYAGIGKTDSALQYFHQALMYSSISNESINMGRIQQRIAEIYASLHQYDSCIYYARRGFADAHRTSQKLIILESADLLARLYRMMRNPDSAYYFTDITATMKDSLYGMEKFKQLQLLMLEEQQREQQTVKTQEQYRNRVKYTILLCTTGVLLLLSFILLRNNRQKQKAKAKIENAYSQLKAAQAQLIQSEKMASLGELTAGIAHEIQNPLNFVNNFSEVSKELIDEMKSERTKVKGERDEKLEEELLDDIAQNLDKINHHGKRADAIVKGMLEHSKSGSAEKELTNINTLAKEYLNLAFQRFKNKNKDFNGITQTDFDESLPKINLVRQDIGRVLLNLINNALYVVAEVPNPVVTLSTKKLGDTIQISVSDNGKGVPDSIKDKIFQPFFTTKPTGQGTGLGLSLSYDIVKAHGGELKVETKEGEGSVFSMVLPI